MSPFEQQIRTHVRTALIERLAALVGSEAAPTHTNSDDRFTPAQWWVDEEKTIRHSMATTASIRASGLTLTVALNYNITES